MHKKCMCYDTPMFLTRFAHTIWRASTDARSYMNDFAGRRTGSALGYLYALTCTIAFFMMLPLIVGLALLAPKATTLANTHLTTLQNWYPDELILTISGGVLSTNTQEPIVFDLPEEWQSLKQNSKTHAIVIDTAASIEDFDTYDTAALLTKTSLVMEDQNGLRVMSLSEAEHTIITEDVIAGYVTLLTLRITPFLPWLTAGAALFFLLVLPWILGGVFWAMNLFFLLWASLLLLLASSVMGRGLPYGTLYRLGAFGLTSSLLLGFALNMTSLSAAWAPNILFFGWMIAVLSVFPKRSSKRSSVPLPPAAVAVKKARKPVTTKTRAKGQKSA